MSKARGSPRRRIAEIMGTPRGKEALKLIEAHEKKLDFDPNEREGILNGANLAELGILQKAGVITRDEYRALRVKLDETLHNQAVQVPQESQAPPTEPPKEPVNPKVLNKILEAPISELRILMAQGLISPQQFDDELKRRPKDEGPFEANGVTGVPVEYGNWSYAEAKDFIVKNVPQNQQSGLLIELEDFQKRGINYSVTIGRDNRGYRLKRFQTPNPWDTVKKDATQSVTREVRRETGKQLSRLINPDYSHNEVVSQYMLVRDALPPGSATRQALDKVDGAVKILLTTGGISVEAVNLLVNAVRGALLEAPELKYKVASLLPDDVVRQGFVAAVRAEGNTLRRYIHNKYHLPDRPKQTPVMVNTLEQIKPEHYRQQDAQKVGITMRDLSREKAIEFIHENVPVEKQESAIETIGRLKGNQFGVSIMDSGWVRIDASAREQRQYTPSQYEPRRFEAHSPDDHRRKWVASYDATKPK